VQPRELVVSGLTSFTGRVVVDFADVDLFALVGPTGAGKSSVIDAMVLALYGRVPRLHANEVAPVISSSASECTVGLTFTVRGRPHRAVRSIRRTASGASTVEAVLEQLDDDGQVVTTLAGTADDLTAEVERLIGLSFDEFTRAVVLPQGEFARVLRAKASERQSLLARLLGTGVYDRVKQRAGAHARAAQDRADQIAHQIAQLGSPTPDDVAVAAARASALDALVQRLAEDAEALLRVRDGYRDAAAAATRARARVDRLGAVDAPPGEVRDLADRIAEADRLVEKRRSAVEAAEVTVADAEAAAADVAQLDQVVRLVALHDRTAELDAARSAAEAALPPLRQQIDELAAELVAAESASAAATAAQAAVHREHAAVQAVQGLAAGDGCPVCAAPLAADAPALQQDAGAAAGAVAAAAADVAAAVEAVATTRTRLDRARADLDAAVLACERAVARAAEHLAALEGQPGRAEAQQRIDAARAQQQRIAGLRTEVRRAREDLADAVRDRAALDDRAAAVAGRLDRLRLAVAGDADDADPLPPVTGDVAADWAALHRWAAAALPRAADAADAADAAVAAVQQQGVALRDRMESALAAAGVAPGEGDPRDRAVRAHAEAAAAAAQLARLLEVVDGYRAEAAEARETAVVAAELARLLRADQFQKWLLDEATRALVVGASAQLRTLSSGRYELALDGRSAIQVVDLASAGAVRSVRTLSGGETFLASLALALSLAEQIAASASGPVALESLFIDEGFGALDPETLDIAAGAIELLGAGDRTVGVVTHIPEIADRMPTRFLVRRTASGSAVERVDA
jgi:DNA repair protein SbcC/Rad50